MFNLKFLVDYIIAFSTIFAVYIGIIVFCVYFKPYWLHKINSSKIYFYLIIVLSVFFGLLLTFTSDYLNRKEDLKNYSKGLEVGGDNMLKVLGENGYLDEKFVKDLRNALKNKNCIIIH
jgi:hypothetical protein